MRFEALLARNVRGLWATSYSFGLKLFDQYLLRKLSQSPLNAVVLADHDKVADVWEHLPEGEHYLAKQVGRRYLLRGVQLPGGGAFHPKTYLFARSDQATLVVGSGNLTRDGIDQGREVFTSFSTQRDQDLPSVRAWAAWMSRLVKSTGDELLHQRWVALREACPWMIGPTDGSLFLVNDERPILTQLAERLPDTIAELHVSAPFFDRHAQALDRLIHTCAPQRVVLYLGAGASVHGPSLAAVLRKADDVVLRRFEPRTFVHAKLVGLVGPDGHGALLTGSPNLSRAALILSCGGDGRGNCETAVVRAGSGEQVRDVFEGSGLTLVDQPLDVLDEPEFGDDHPTLARPLVLRSAAWRSDGRIALKWSGGAALPAGTSLSWDDSGESVAVDVEGMSAERLHEREPLPLIARLIDTDGKAVSNRVVIDDPAALQATLSGSDRKASSRPSDMDGLEMLPLIRLVLWAHDKFIFDLDDTSAFRRVQDAVVENADPTEAADFWERYAEEELQDDARSQTYRALTASGGLAGPVDELLRELQLLLYASPGVPHPILRVLTAGSSEGDDEEQETKPGTPWTMEARQRVRAYHLLSRWSAAVADPRHTLLAPDAAVVNYQTLLAVVLLAWLHEALEVKQLRRLLLTLLEAFIGATDKQGFLGRIDDDELAAALERLDPFMVEVAAGLVCTALGRHAGWQEDIYDWQPVLQRGVELGIILPGEWSAIVVERITGTPTATQDIDRLIDERMSWIDNGTWCARLAEELDLREISFDLHRRATVSAAIRVRGPTDPLNDVRLLTVARKALDFKRLPAIAVECGEQCLLIFEPGQRARARVGGAVSRSSRPISAARFKEIEQQGGSWADVLDTQASDAGTNSRSTPKR